MGQEESGVNEKTDTGKIERERKSEGEDAADIENGVVVRRRRKEELERRATRKGGTIRVDSKGQVDYVKLEGKTDYINPDSSSILSR